jgi:hypothetical protein
MIKNVLSDFNETRILWKDFRKNSQIWNLMKIRLLGAELFHADGRTDMAKLIVALRNFANVPKNSLISWQWLKFKYQHRWRVKEGQ